MRLLSTVLPLLLNSNSATSLLGRSSTRSPLQLFLKISSLLYDCFKQEKVIDARAEEAFIDNIHHAPPLTEAEDRLIKDSMNTAKELFKVAKRVPGTVGDPVEKFLHRPEQGGAGWGITVVKVDIPATALFAKLWLCDSYAKRAELSNLAIREVWLNLDGSRSLQYSRSVNLPGGFQDRFLELWMTWGVFADEEGRKTFALANAPIEEYQGTRHRVPGREKFQMATSRGILIVQELTNGTCLFSRVQQVRSCEEQSGELGTCRVHCGNMLIPFVFHRHRQY